MAASRQITLVAVLAFIASSLAAFAYTQDWRPALAVDLFQAVLLRIALALRGLAVPKSGVMERSSAYSAA